MLELIVGATLIALMLVSIYFYRRHSQNLREVNSRKVKAAEELRKAVEAKIELDNIEAAHARLARAAEELRQSAEAKIERDNIEAAHARLARTAEELRQAELAKAERDNIEAAHASLVRAAEAKVERDILEAARKAERVQRREVRRNVAADRAAKEERQERDEVLQVMASIQGVSSRVKDISDERILLLLQKRGDEEVRHAAERRLQSIRARRKAADLQAQRAMAAADESARKHAQEAERKASPVIGSKARMLDNDSVMSDEDALMNAGANMLAFVRDRRVEVFDVNGELIGDFGRILNRQICAMWIEYFPSNTTKNIFIVTLFQYYNMINPAIAKVAERAILNRTYKVSINSNRGGWDIIFSSY